MAPNTMKTNLDSQLTSRIESFARELQDLVRQHALEAVHSVLSGNRKAIAPRAQAATPATRPSKKVGRRATKKTGARRGRPAADLSAITEPIVSLLRATPGQRAEDLARGLRMTPKELKRPIDRLLADGAVRKEGKARATRYYVA